MQLKQRDSSRSYWNFPTEREQQVMRLEWRQLGVHLCMVPNNGFI